MKTISKGLSFRILRQANLKRLPEFKNNKGQQAHSKKDGSDWTPSQWVQAVLGELGEYANFRKKFERGDINELEFKQFASDELADVIIYLDILSYRLGIDLEDAVRDKFNKTSKKVGSQVYLGLEDYFLKK